MKTNQLEDKALLWRKIDKRIRQYLPLGQEYKGILLVFLVTLGITGIYTTSYFRLFHNFRYSQAFWLEHQVELPMEYFVILLGGGFFPFIFLFLGEFSLIALLYRNYYQGSQSIYLMKRLPNPWEMWKRVLVFPLSLMGITLFIGQLLLFVYYCHYLKYGVNIPDGQWEIFLDVCLNGGKKYVEIMSGH